MPFGYRTTKKVNPYKYSIKNYLCNPNYGLNLTQSHTLRFNYILS